MSRAEAPPASTGTGRQSAGSRWVMFAVGWAVFVAADDLTVVSTMLRPIVTDMGLTLPDGLDDAAWAVNAYLIAFVAIMPLAGRISDVIGRRATVMLAYGVFLVGTIVIPLSTSMGPFLVGRVLTALGGGAMLPVALAVVGDEYAEPGRARALGTLGAIETLGWVWGPLYGATLVRFLSWEWQFWLNVPMTLFGMAMVWWALAGHVRRADHERPGSVDWIGAAALTTLLVTLNLALLGNAEIQSVTGFDELDPSTGFDFRWLLIPAAGSAWLAWRRQRSADAPLLARGLFRGRNVKLALGVNAVVGAALVIAMVDVPLFINAVEIDLEDSAVASGWVLAALTSTMAITSYVGGRVTEKSGYRIAVVSGLVAAFVAYLVMGVVWQPATSHLAMALHLGLLGAGVGMVVAPTSAVVVDSAEPRDRGAAASLVMVARLVGLSVGLSALTAWGLHRYDQLRSTVDLPPITDPGFADAAQAVQAQLTADAIAETFLAAALVVLAGVIAGMFLTNRTQDRPDLHSAPNGAFAQQGGQAMGPNDRLLRISLAALASALLFTILAVAVLFGRSSDADDRVARLEAQLDDMTDQRDQLADDLQRVEAGAALFAGQVTAFQERIVALEPEFSAGIDEAISGLESFGSSTLTFDVDVDETIQIDTEVVIDRDIDVPIDETIPIDEVIDTTIRIDTPLGNIPVDVQVPVKLDVPIQLDVSIPVNETIPVTAEVPVKLAIPITVDVADTELASLTKALADGLIELRNVLSGLAG